MAWVGARSARTPPAGRWQKKKGRAGMAVQPKSREETPKVGTPWWAGPGHGADVDMGVFVLRCNLTPVLLTIFRKNVAGWQRGVCQMATLELPCNRGAPRAARG